jgi:raffinose/stachyose/melibiose transport system substrate-binding protein
MRRHRPLRYATAVGLLAGAVATVVLGASGSALAKSSGPKASITVWFVDGGAPVNNLLDNTAKKFNNSHPGDHVTVDIIENTPYKQKLQLAMGAHNPPTVFFTWGGGPLEQYINAGDVVKIGKPSWLKTFLPASLGNCTLKGTVWCVPVEGTGPVYFYYNKALLASTGIGAFPTTFDQLVADIAKAKAAGVSLISLADESNWEGLMYLEYLTDRIGGPKVFENILAGKKNAWNNSAITGALTDIQTLVKDGAFNTGYNSIDFPASDALVYSGKAVMQLMGSWDVSSIQGEDASFETGGQLGQAAFPAVSGGQGNAKDLAGNTVSGYLAIAKHSSSAQQAVATEFLSTMFETKSYASALVSAGQVPVINGTGGLLSSSPIGSFLTAQYNDVKAAPFFQYSWDQSVPPAQAQPMLTNLGDVFNLTETPAQFVSTMDAVKG